jgi:hypothetical protein
VEPPNIHASGNIVSPAPGWKKQNQPHHRTNTIVSPNLVSNQFMPPGNNMTLPDNILYTVKNQNSKNMQFSNPNLNQQRGPALQSPRPLLNQTLPNGQEIPKDQTQLSSKMGGSSNET